MKEISSHEFHVLSDFLDVRRFMVEIYEKDWSNGVPAPFLEYALSSDWMDKSFVHKNRIWRDNNKIVGFCFYENPISDIYFSLRPGYEEIAYDMVAHAEQHMPGKNNKKLIIFEGQQAIKAAAAKLAYKQTNQWTDLIYTFDKPLSYELPAGFAFTEPGGLDMAKVSECCWKGFDHEEAEGAWSGEVESLHHLMSAPHATFEHALAVVDGFGNYCCYAGMWWVPENKLAYMEPFCTVPEHRKKGLAAAALSELYRRMKPLGASHMTGGSSPFYQKIGYTEKVIWTAWEKD